MTHQIKSDGDPAYWTIKVRTIDGLMSESYERGYLQDAILDRIELAELEFVNRAYDFIAQENINNMPDIHNSYVKLYKKLLKGSVDSALKAYWLLPDNTTRLLFTLNLWDEQSKVSNFSKVWGAILRCCWTGGKSGSLLMQSSITLSLLVEMFKFAEMSTLMNKAEINSFKSMPDIVEVWRGVSETSDYGWNGLSWTTNRLQAEWFAYRNVTKNEKCFLLEGEVSKKELLAYFENEWEIVINPLKNCISKKSEFLLERNDSTEKLLALKGELKKMNTFNTTTS